MGASQVDAFMGINGPADQPGAIGLVLNHVNFGLAIMNAKDWGTTYTSM
jgi:hypothetical protein